MQPQERKIFGPYDSGAATVCADPVAVHRRLVHALDGQPNDILARTRSPLTEEAFPATEKLLAAVAFAFGLQTFDPATGKGLLEDEVLAVLNAYLAFLEKKNRSPASSPTGAPPTTSPLAA